MPLLLRLVLALAAVPLVVGSLIYWTWRFTRWPFLERAGMLTIVLGIGAVIVGAAGLLLRFLWRESRGPRTTRGPLRVQGVLAGSLLLLNFPVAAFYTLSAVDISTRYTLRLDNKTESAIESFVVIGPGIELEMGPLAPGQSAQQHLHFRGDGSLRFAARQQETEFSGELEGYVTGGLGGDKTIRVIRKGAFEVAEQGNAQAQ